MEERNSQRRRTGPAIWLFTLGIADGFSLSCAQYPESIGGMKGLLRIAAVVSCVMLALPLRAQTAPPASERNPMADIPSEAEVGELTAKAAEKVETFQKTLDAIRPFLDKADPSAYKKDENAVEAARSILAALKKNGRSAYGLVSLLTTLDDLDLDATQDSQAILIFGTRAMSDGRQPPDGMTTAVLMLTSAASSLYDISELVMHATLRFVGGEEAVLAQVFSDKK